ncbi:MAG: phage tail tube protein [Gallionella sp.]|jgi:hypothetical protein
MQVTGRVFVNVAGKRLASREGATMKFGGTERQPELADTGVVGFSEKTIAPEVECTLVHVGQTSLKEFQDMTDVPLTFTTDTGKSFIFTNAWCAGGLELSKSELKLKFNAIDCKEA